MIKCGWLSFESSVNVQQPTMRSTGRPMFGDHLVNFHLCGTLRRSSGCPLDWLHVHTQLSRGNVSKCGHLEKMIHFTRMRVRHIDVDTILTTSWGFPLFVVVAACALYKTGTLALMAALSWRVIWVIDHHHHHHRVLQNVWFSLWVILIGGASCYGRSPNVSHVNNSINNNNDVNYM